MERQISPIFKIGDEIFTSCPCNNYGSIIKVGNIIDGYQRYDIRSDSGVVYHDISEGVIAFAHFDSITEAYHYSHIHHVGFVVGCGNLVYTPKGNRPKSKLIIDLGVSTELNEAHVNIYQTHLSSINHTGTSLSLISNEYLPHLRMTEELSKEDFKFVIKIIRRDWEYIKKSWNEGDTMWSPDPIQITNDYPPNYNYETITRRNSE